MTNDEYDDQFCFPPQREIESMLGVYGQQAKTTDNYWSNDGLRKLSQGITQGNWCVNDDKINLGYAIKQAGVNGMYIGCVDGSIPASELNAIAVSMVPLMIAEIIGLRKTVAGLTNRLNEMPDATLPTLR